METAPLPAHLQESIDLLKEYLRTAPIEELKEDWARVKAMGLEGPTLDEILSYGKSNT